jgi:hypothetical protein
MSELMNDVYVTFLKHGFQVRRIKGGYKWRWAVHTCWHKYMVSSPSEFAAFITKHLTSRGG